MKVQMEVDEKKLRRLAHLLIVGSRDEIKAMSDEELVLACMKNSTYATSNIQIMKGSDE